MEVGERYRKQPKVGSHHSFEAGPGALGLLRVDGTAALLDTACAGERRNAPSCSEKFVFFAGAPGINSRRSMAPEGDGRVQ